MRRLILLLGLVIWTGCKGGVDKTLVQVVEEIHPLSSTGTLKIQNEDGSMRLYGSNAAQFHVKAIKRAYSDERLNALAVRIISRTDSATLETVSPPRRKWSLRDRSGTVDYTVTFPQYLKAVETELVNGEISIDGLRNGSATARLHNGRISARNCFANLDYEAKNGAIDFYYDWWEVREFVVKAAIPNGGIGLFLPRGASFYLDAETKGGRIIGNFIDEDEKIPGHRKRVSTKIGTDSGPRFQLRAVNGNIRIHGY